MMLILLEDLQIGYRIGNRTKVAIAVVGTEDAYSKMFTHLRTARRLGNIISGNLYCEIAPISAFWQNAFSSTSGLIVRSK